MLLQLPKPEDLALNDKEKVEIANILANPAAQKYFAMINLQAMVDVTQNPVNSKEEEVAFLSRYRSYLGVQQVCTLLATFSKKG